MNHGGGYGIDIPARICFHGTEKVTQRLEIKLTKNDKNEKQLKESLSYCLKQNIIFF